MIVAGGLQVKNMRAPDPWRKACTTPSLTATACTWRDQPQIASRHGDRIGLTIDGNRLTYSIAAPSGSTRCSTSLTAHESRSGSLYLHFRQRPAGDAVRDALAQAARARAWRSALLIDGFGTSADARENHFKPLRERGRRLLPVPCRLRPPLPASQPSEARSSPARRIAELIGGFNIEDDYFRTTATGAGATWASDRRARGRAPHAAISTNCSYGRLTHAAKLRRLRCARYAAQRDARQAAVAIQRSAQPQEPLRARSRAIWSTAGDVEMIAAYFAPPWALLRRHRTGRCTGRARVITAAKSDNTPTIAAARYTYARLLGAGSRSIEYQPTKLHTKLRSWTMWSISARPTSTFEASISIWS